MWYHDGSGRAQSSEPEDVRACRARLSELEASMAKFSTSIPPCVLPLASLGITKPPLPQLQQQKIPWASAPAGATSSASGRVMDCSLACMKTTAELDQALQAWKVKRRAAGGDGRTAYNLVFASSIGSARELHDITAAMGIQLMCGPGQEKRGQHLPSPPYGQVSGDANQPSIKVTYKVGRPEMTATFQLLNKRERKLVVHSRQMTIDNQIENWLTFFGPVIEVSSAMPVESDAAAASSGGPSVRALLKSLSANVGSE